MLVVARGRRGIGSCVERVSRYACVDLREKSEDVLCRDCLRRSRSGTHFARWRGALEVVMKAIDLRKVALGVLQLGNGAVKVESDVVNSQPNK